MDRKAFFENVDCVIRDWNSTGFTFVPKTHVPGIDDPCLTFGNGEEKKGIELNTCVLYVDIRNSVQLTKNKQDRTMGRLYSVFTHGVLLAAQQEGGFVRNIIGDRVMVVFPEENCFTKAVNCAITINHIARMINNKIDNLEFKCGIGVDYGKIRVLKVGIKKSGTENDDNKGIVWVGYPANFASRLTDCANKEFTDVMYEVDAEYYEYNHLQTNLFFSHRPSGWYRKTMVFTAEELAGSLFVTSGMYGTSIVSNKFRNPYSIQKKETPYKYEPILLSEKVYNGYKTANPRANSIVNEWWKEQTRKIKDIDFKVIGANLWWDI